MPAVYIELHKTTFIMEENTMNPDQTAPKEQSDLGSYCLQYTTSMHINIQASRRQVSWMAGKRVDF